MIEFYGTDEVISENPGQCMLCCKDDSTAEVVVKIMWDDVLVRLAVCGECRKLESVKMIRILTKEA